MQTKATFAIAEVKAAASEHPNGEFEIVMSTDSVDRDGEIIVKGAFDPLPESIPVHAFHDFNDPIGRAVPGYNDAGQLVGRGFFASTARAQEMRQLVSDGVIGHTSVGFMAADREVRNGVPHIKAAELLEVSFVSVPSNRDAAVLAVKAGARNNTKDAERLQSIHDLAVANGALCAASADGAKAADDNSFATGDRVVIDPGSRHDPEHSSGTIAEIGSTAYGVVIDGMESMGVHRWYVAEEMAPADAPPAAMTRSTTDTTAPDPPAVAGKAPASVVTQARLTAARALLDTV